MRWMLSVDRSIIAYLHSLREGGQDLRLAVWGLGEVGDAAIGALAVSDRPGRYELFACDHWIGFEMVQAEQLVRALYVEPN